MFLGEYHLSVDRGGRLCLPECMRYVLRECYAPDDTELILSMFFERCLVCYPKAEWFKVPERLRSMGASPGDIRDFQEKKAVCLLELWAPNQWEAYVAGETGRR